MNPLTDKITAAILDAPGDLQGVPPVVVRAVVARAHVIGSLGCLAVMHLWRD